MKLIISIILIAFLSSLTEFFLPWWTITVVAFIVSLVIGLRPGQAFLAGFLGITIYWLPNIIFKDFSNDHILSRKMANLFHLPNYIIFIIVCVILGSLLGGLAAFSASFFRKKENIVKQQFRY